jgi:flagellar motor component MotA
MTTALTIIGILIAVALIFIGIVIAFFGVMGFFSNKMKKELDEDGFYD